MSEKSNAIPLLESNNPPPIAVRRKTQKGNCFKILKTLIFVALIILVIVLIVALIVMMQKKCYDGTKVENKMEKVKIAMRENNSYWNEYNLPNFANTGRYDITLQLLTEAFNLTQHNKTDYFFGRVAINLTMHSDSRFLVLSAMNIVIRSLAVNRTTSSSTGRSIGIVEKVYDRFYQQVILVFNTTLLKSENYTVEMTYSGNITVSESGVIRTFYRNLIYKKDYDILYSKLEPIGARRMFPCFDEPDRKALYLVRIIHLEKYTALSNMPLRERRSIDKTELIFDDLSLAKNLTMVISEYDQTVVAMSTYLVAFVLVENYTAVSKIRKPGFNVSIWGPEGFQESGIVSLSYAASSENFFEEYLKYSSPYPKSDHIYIPNFLSGAMENWGLMTYRENHLLMSPTRGEFFLKKAYMTIAHELAHIWFGNWVTTKTWSDLWLNEGFATYFASVAYFAQLNFDLDKRAQMYLYQHRQILDKDGKQPSYPVRLEVVNFKNIFSSFTYYKGASMLEWLRTIMGQTNFSTGIQKYVAKYAVKSPTTEQFFAEMETLGASKFDFNASFSEFFRPWLNRIGYPVITVNYDIDNELLLLSQKSIVANSSINETWPIYTTFKTDQIPADETIFFRQRNFSKAVKLSENGFVQVNSDGKSYVRINYSDHLWTKLIDNIKSGHVNLNPTNKIVLFDDNLFFADNNLVNISVTKRLLDTLENENDIVPWLLFYNKIFNKMFDLFSDDKTYAKWSRYVKKLSKKILKEAFLINADTPGNIYNELYQRQIFIMNCEIDNVEVLNFLSDRFKTWIKHPTGSNLPKHLVSSILYYGIKINDRTTSWMTMWDLTRNESLQSSLREQIAIGLTGTSKPFLLNQLLNYLLVPKTHSSNIEKYALTTNLVTWILQSNNGVNILRRWILKNHNRIKLYAFGDHVPRETAESYLESILVKMASSTYDMDAIRPLFTLHRNHVLLSKTVTMNNHWRENVGRRLLQNL